MRRNAFTLIEILMVILLISILAGMVTAAVSAAGDTAKRSRTRAIIATIDDVLSSKYEKYRTRPLPVVVPNYNQMTEVSVSVPPREAARVRLMMIRDLMRMELPDRISDVLDPPMRISAATRRVLMDPSTGTYDDTQPLVPRQVDWFTGPNLPAALFSYRNRIPVPNSQWTRENENAECLYMILATTFMDGVPAISGIPSSNIGDTDGDGMPEILDGWGSPIGFIRWPVGYVAGDESIPGIDIPDPFDPFRVDWSYVPGTTNVPSAHPVTTGSPSFALKPLIVSAGSDREYGIRFGFNHVANQPFNYTDDIRYSQMRWPVSQMGGDATGHANPYFYIDPYDRHPEANRQGGQPRPAVGETLNGEQQADNITNYELQETT